MVSEQKIILLSTPTSGTGSLWRILRTLSPKSYKSCELIDAFLNQGIKFEDIVHESIPKDFNVYLFNQPHLFNFQQDLSDFKFVINLRDPRDLICNQYHWIFVHPVAKEMEQQVEIRRQQVREQGISGFTRQRDISFFYNAFFKLFEKVPRENICVVSYAQLCLMSDTVIDNVASFIGSPFSADELEAMKEKEFPSALQDNPAWVSGTWVGSDLLPGRARIELSRATYKELTERYKPILEFMQQVDLKELSGVYK